MIDRLKKKRTEFPSMCVEQLKHLTQTSVKFSVTKTTPVVANALEITEPSKLCNIRLLSVCFSPILFTVQKYRHLNGIDSQLLHQKIENEALNSQPHKTQLNTLIEMCICRQPKTFFLIWPYLMSLSIDTIKLLRLRARESKTNRSKKKTHIHSIDCNSNEGYRSVVNK